MESSTEAKAGEYMGLAIPKVAAPRLRRGSPLQEISRDGQFLSSSMHAQASPVDAAWLETATVAIVSPFLLDCCLVLGQIN